MRVDPQEFKHQRCAIYTRKSVDQGLNQEFNSLETQRTICSAYITSQLHKNWYEIHTRYDDAGKSGATLERPALQHLLGDIELGLVDVVVVYKLDRITRTLIDFVRLMDLFKRYDVSFVSITQNFDTADSMGRLILNVLLTFAQFEREIIADRIRDKQRVLRQAGRWVSGSPPFGYRSRNRILQIDEEQAKAVRFIFERFVELGNYNAVLSECRQIGVRSHRWKAKSSGLIHGGKPMSLGVIYKMIANPVYAGFIRSDGELFSGLHKAIIGKALWEQAQKIRERLTRAPPPVNKLLADVLHDCFGRTMGVHYFRNPSGNSRGYYYSNQNAWGKRHKQDPLWARADALEDLVKATLKKLLSDKRLIRSGLMKLGRYEDNLDALSERSDLAACSVDDLKPRDLKAVIRSIFARLELSRDRLKAVVRWCEVERYLAWDGIGIYKIDEATSSRPTKTHLLDIACPSVCCAPRLRLPFEPRNTPEAKPVRGLFRLVRDARRAQALVDQHRAEPVSALAGRMHLTNNRFVQILQLNYLAPDIVTAILDGTQPPELTRTKLMQATLPLDWALQRRILGFPPRADAH
jgi:site-specific DNA recombinase